MNPGELAQLDALLDRVGRAFGLSLEQSREVVPASAFFQPRLDDLCRSLAVVLEIRDAQERRDRGLVRGIEIEHGLVRLERLVNVVELALENLARAVHQRDALVGGCRHRRPHPQAVEELWPERLPLVEARERVDRHLVLRVVFDDAPVRVDGLVGPAELRVEKPAEPHRELDSRVGVRLDLCAAAHDVDELL